MGFATHLGPWLLGTVKETTGTTPGTIRNTGATEVAQMKTTAYTDASASTLACVPAGAIVKSLQLFQTTTYTSGSTGTLAVALNGNLMATTTITSGTAGILSLTPSTAGATAYFNNVGTTDGVLTYTGMSLSAGAGTLMVSYIVRDPSGASYPTSA